jgi:YD repeat-containing protein
MRKSVAVKRSFLFTVLIFLLFSVFTTGYVRAEIAGPGWHTGILKPDSTDNVGTLPTSLQDIPSIENNNLETVNMASTASTTSSSGSDEIAELARALQYDPKLIYDYVHNHIEYVPYYGLHKGALLTYLDGSGNDFDQAGLMIALLLESVGKNPDVTIETVRYVRGDMTASVDQLANWLGVDADWNIVRGVLLFGGIPHNQAFCTDSCMLRRIWVKAKINGSNYHFDPAFKSYEYIDGIDIGSALIYSQTDLLNSAGGDIGADYVQTLNEDGIRSKLSEYTGNLINEIRTQYPNSEVSEIVGGRKIIQTNLDEYTPLSALPYLGSIGAWNPASVPDSHQAKLNIQLLKYENGNYVPMGINKHFKTVEFTGKRLTLTFSDNGIPELRLDGAVESTGIAYNNTYSLYIFIDHPYVLKDLNGNPLLDDDGYPYTNSDGTPLDAFADQFAFYDIAPGMSYAVVSDFGGTADALLQKRQKMLEQYIDQGLPNGSEEIMGESLNLMGLNWMKQFSLTNRLLSNLADTVFMNHHNIGIMAQEEGYYIDLKQSYITAMSKHGDLEDAKAHFKVASSLGSALEHTIIEQSMAEFEGISTVKIFKVANDANNNYKIYYLDSGNFDTLKSVLINNGYDPNLVDDGDPDTMMDFRSRVDNGFTFILPEYDDVGLKDWNGTGYIGKRFTDTGMSLQMAISGGHLGGDVTCNICFVNGNKINNATKINTYNSSLGDKITNKIKSFVSSVFGDPVDVASGAFIHENTDLSLGSGSPRGLAFTRLYNSSMNREKSVLGYGWTHNYDIYLTKNSHGDPGLGMRQPVDAAPLITVLYASLDLMKTDDTDTLLKWVESALISKWAVDQLTGEWVNDELIRNAITVHMGNKLMEFIKLPDDTYSPPPGITSELIDNGDGTFSLLERFGTQLDFDTDDRISQMTDIDGNTLTFNYVTDGLKTVQDTFGHTITLYYGHGEMYSVSDSAGRSVFYYHTGDDLTGYRDAEGKLWSFAYDDANNPHRMTGLTNPLGITTATNTYDSLGRVMEQTVPRQNGSVKYYFYFSGFRNVEVDPDGNQTVYYFDKKGRPIGEENKLGHKTTKEYDGQFHVLKVTDPLLNETIFEYDRNQNLIKTTNALLQSTDFKYDTGFRLTDTIDPLLHGSHLQYDSEHHPELSQFGVQYNASLLPVDSGIFQTSATYYPDGHQHDGLTESTTDGRGTVTTLAYDFYGNPETVTTGIHPPLSISFNSIGLMTSLTDQMGSTTTFVYDNSGLITSRTDPLGNITNYYYDDAGRLDHVIDRNGNTTSFAYTPTSKLETITYPDTAPDPSVSFTYNQHDDLTEMQDSLGTSRYIYDAAHRLTSQTNANGFTVSYNYDEAGNLTSLTYPGNKTVMYTYDELNRLETVTIDWLGQTATYQYDDAGKLDWIDNFNGTITDYDYDNANRLTDLENRQSDNGIITDYHFTLDGNGNREQIMKSEPIMPVLNLSTSTYTYNVERNRLENANGETLTYDDEGQIYTRGSDTYAFDHEHRLISVQQSGSSDEYYYDGIGNRLMADRNGNDG